MFDRAAELTLGPVLFNWPADRWRDFYFRIADEAPIDAVYLGEVVCSKRAPFFEPFFDEVTERLATAGKQVVLSTLAEVVLRHDRQLVEKISSVEDLLVEANDGSALLHLRGRDHHVGPYINVYNERTARFLAHGGARNFCLPPEMPAAGIRALCAATADLDASIEVQVFGRVQLALSARCYHARAHGRSRDSCQFVCERDPDGLDLHTLEGRPFLTVNGIQTLSYDYLNLVNELSELRGSGVNRFRLSPHDCDMMEVIAAFRAVLDKRIDAAEAALRLESLRLQAPFANGFYYGKPGHAWTGPAVARSHAE